MTRDCTVNLLLIAMLRVLLESFDQLYTVAILWQSYDKHLKLSQTGGGGGLRVLMISICLSVCLLLEARMN